MESVEFIQHLIIESQKENHQEHRYICEKIEQLEGRVTSLRVKVAAIGATAGLLVSALATVFNRFF